MIMNIINAYFVHDIIAEKRKRGTDETIQYADADLGRPRHIGMFRAGT